MGSLSQMGWKLVKHIHAIPRKHLQFERINKGWLSLTDVATSSVEFLSETNVTNPDFSFVVKEESLPAWCSLFSSGCVSNGYLHLHPFALRQSQQHPFTEHTFPETKLLTLDPIWKNFGKMSCSLRQSCRVSIKNWIAPYQRSPEQIARAIRYSRLGIRALGPVGDFLEGPIYHPFILGKWENGWVCAAKISASFFQNPGLHQPVLTRLQQGRP